MAILNGEVTAVSALAAIADAHEQARKLKLTMTDDGLRDALVYVLNDLNTAHYVLAGAIADKAEFDSIGVPS